jgi:hypothetical protein
MIASIDIFDTALTRLVGLPDSLFILLGNRLCSDDVISVGAEVFAHNRKSAEDLSRGNAPNGEPTLEEIYCTLRWMLGITQEVSDRIMLAELALEMELLRPMPGAARMIAELTTRSGSNLVFVSDMYLASAFLEEQLSRLLGLKKPISIMVSSECRESKRTGGLFRRLLQERAAEPRDLVHFGNDPVSDGAVPARMGINTKLFRDAELNRYEALMESHRWGSSGLTSLFAGASRMARLTIPAKNKKEEVIRDVAASVAAPVLVGYVLWVLRRAVNLGIKRLYFVSRDGEVLLEIASSLAAKLGLQLELRYLYGSRQAWHLPSCGLSNQSEDDWLFANNPHGLSVEILLKKLGLKPGEIEEALARHGFPEILWQATLDPDRIKTLRLALSDPEIRSCIMDRAGKARELMLRYLRQEGLTEPIPIGLVDIGWSGRMFDSLWAVLKQERSLSPCGFLFAWYGTGISPGSMTKEGYIFDVGLGMGCGAGGSEELLETFCAGSHGMVCGYTEREHRIEPVLTQPVNRYAQEWGIPVLRDTLRAFVANLYVHEQFDFLRVEIRHTVRDLLAKFWNDPTRVESSVWGTYRHAATQTESSSSPLAQPYSFLQILNRLLGRPTRVAGSSWYAGSLKLTPITIRCGIKAARRIRKAWRPLRYPRQGLASE